MAISLRSLVSSAFTGTTSASGGTGDFTGIGDLILVFIVDHATSGTSAAPSLWTAVPSANVAGTAGRLQAFYRFATTENSSGLLSTFTGLTSRALSSAFAFAGVNQTTPFDVTSSARLNASGTTGTTSITPVTNNNMIVAAFGSLSNGATWSLPTTATSPGALTLFDSSPNSSFCSLGLAYNLQATAGATGASSATMSVNTANSGILISLRPAANPRQLAVMGAGI